MAGNPFAPLSLSGCSGWLDESPPRRLSSWRTTTPAPEPSGVRNSTRYNPFCITISFWARRPFTSVSTYCQARSLTYHIMGMVHVCTRMPTKPPLQNVNGTKNGSSRPLMGPNSPSIVARTSATYRCDDCGETVIHTTDWADLAWR